MSYLSATVVSAAFGIFGLRRLVSGYAGNCVNLRRTDNTTSDFGFASGSDELDIAGIVAWNAVNSGGAGQLYIVTWYDQSGLGANLTQATTSKQPSLELTGNFQHAQNTKSTFRADGFPVLMTNDAITPQTLGAYLDSTVGSLSNQNIQALTVSRFNDQYYDQQHTGPIGPAFQLGTSTGVEFSLDYAYVRVDTVSPVTAKFVEFDFSINGNFPSVPKTKSWRTPNSCLAVRSIRNNGTRTYVRYGNWRTNNATPGISASAVTGFRFGLTQGTGSSAVCAATAFVLTTALGTSDEQAAMDTLAETWGIKNSPGAIVAVAGDSISSGYTGGLFDIRTYSWFYEVSRTIGSRAVWFNSAQSGGWIGKLEAPYANLPGEGVGTAAVQFGPQAPDALDRLLDGGAFPNSVLIVWGGRNDLTLFGASAGTGFGQAVHDVLRRYCLARKAAGWRQVLVMDAIPGNDMDSGLAATTGAMESERRIFNALIATAWREYADEFVKLSALNWTPNNSYSTYYIDSVHPNTAGQALAASVLVPAVRRCLDRARYAPPLTTPAMGRQVTRPSLRQARRA